MLFDSFKLLVNSCCNYFSNTVNVPFKRPYPPRQCDCRGIGRSIWVMNSKRCGRGYGALSNVNDSGLTRLDFGAIIGRWLGPGVVNSESSTVPAFTLL